MLFRLNAMYGVKTRLADIMYKAISSSMENLAGITYSVNARGGVNLVFSYPRP